jgi:hypothetical protein
MSNKKLGLISIPALCNGVIRPFDIEYDKINVGIIKRFWLIFHSVKEKKSGILKVRFKRMLF